MGSLPSPPLPTTPPPSPHFNPSGYRVIVAFCPREAGPNTNIFNCIQSYNPSNDTWSHVSLIPDLLENHVLKGFAMVSVGESIYIIGGRLWDKGRPHHNCSESPDEVVNAGVEVSALVLRYDVRLEKWSKCASLRTPRYDFAYSVCDNKIYVAGGKSSLANNARGISSAEVYDPVHDEWSPLPNMRILRYKCVGVTWRGKIYVVGGFAETVDSDQNYTFSPQRSSAEVYNPRTGMWDFVPAMWQLDVPPNQIVEVDGKLFSSGDCLKPWKGHIDFYDETLNMWDEVDGSCFQICRANDGNWPPMERLYLTMAPIGTQLYFFAGYKMAGESSRSFSTVCRFDTSAAVNAWTSLEPMEEDGEKELCSHCCVVQLS